MRPTSTGRLPASVSTAAIAGTSAWADRESRGSRRCDNTLSPSVLPAEQLSRATEPACDDVSRARISTASHSLQLSRPTAPPPRFGEADNVPLGGGIPHLKHDASQPA